MSTKFENRTTTVNALIIDFENMANTKEVTVQVSYTRTIATAQKLVAACMNVDVNRVAVRELVQSEFKAQNLNSGQLVNIAKEYGLNEPVSECEQGFTCIPYTAYQYFGTAFGYTKEDNTAIAIPLVVEQLEKHGKNDARGMLINHAEETYNMNVFALDYKQRHEVKRYAVVNSEEYQKLRYNA